MENKIAKQAKELRELKKRLSTKPPLLSDEEIFRVIALNGDLDDKLKAFTNGKAWVHNEYHDVAKAQREVCIKHYKAEI